MKRFIFILLVLAVSRNSWAAENDLLFILDASGSMKQVTGGESQIHWARKAIRSALGDVPTGAFVGLRVYAHRVGQADKQASCRDSELAVPFTASSVEGIRAKLDSVEPKGYTPIAYSLEQAKSDFPVARESKKTIILLSDGEETCGGDPIAVVKKLRADGFDVRVHVVGFNVDEKTAAQLRGIAEAGDGRYFAAKDGAALSTVLSEATKEAVLIEKKQTTYGKAIRGGDSFENAVPLELGVEYRLDHHQRPREYDYFYLDTARGDTVEVVLKTLDKGVTLRPDGKTIENDQPYAGVTLNGADRARLSSKEIIGGKFQTQTATAVSPAAGKLYVLIGSGYEAMHKDFSTFTVKRVVNGDLESDRDAGDTTEGAMPIEVRWYRSNHLGGPDTKDTFSFDGKKGERYQLGYIPDDGLDAHVTLRVYDEYKSPLTERPFTPRTGGRTDPFTISDDGVYFVQLELPYTEEKIGGYTLELKRVEESPDAAKDSTAPSSGDAPAP